MPIGKVTYSSAAGYIREQVMLATSSKLNASTQKDRKYYVGMMHGYVSALNILLRSPEGKDSEVGFPDYHGTDKSRVLAEVERFVGGPDRMIELGFYPAKEVAA